MKVCLVPCPIIGNSNSGTIEKKRLYPYLPYLPVGLLTLSTLLERAGHQVTILDPIWETGAASSENLAPGKPDDVARLIQTTTPDIVGFSTICSSYPLTIEWAKAFHYLSPGTLILLGGPQATATDEQTLRAFPWIDMVLRGETENSIIPLVTCLQSGSSLDSVPGLTWRSDNHVVRNADTPIILDLDTLPDPAYHLYPVERLFQRYNTNIGPFHQPFPLEAGRGCPFSCSFCSTSGFFRRRYRTKSADRLIHDMVTLHTRYGMDHFDLAHDLFTCDTNYVLNFCHRLREEDIHKVLKWECYSRIDIIDQKILAKMAAAGCVRIFYGIETGSQRMQELIGKNLPLQDVRTVVKETLSLGIRVTTSFICGFPQERPEDLSATLAVAIDMIRMGVDQVALLPLIPLVGSKLYQEFGHSIRSEEQEPRNWPDVFAGLCHYETPYLDSSMLEILPRVVNRYPRLLAALSARNVDVMPVFVRWPEWCHAHSTRVSESYYRGSTFMSDFLRFLQETLSRDTRLSPDLIDVIRYHLVIETVSCTPEDAPIVSERFNCDVPAVMQHLVENKAVTWEDLNPTTYLFWNSEGKVIVRRLTVALAELLGIPQT